MRCVNLIISRNYKYWFLNQSEYINFAASLCICFPNEKKTTLSLTISLRYREQNQM